MRDTSIESANDWVEWKGGCCPVAAESRVEVKLRDNSTHQNDADAIRWSHTVCNRQRRHRDVIAYRVMSAEPKKQPQLGEWWWEGGRVLFCAGQSSTGRTVWQREDGEVFVGQLPPARHLSNCTGFDYVPPPEQTPAEKRLAAVGVDFDGDSYCADSILFDADGMTGEQVEAVGQHMREREGGAQ